MTLKAGSVVYVMAGRDKHRFCAVVRLEPNEAFIADGRARKLEKPKRKNLLHLRPTKTVLEDAQMRTDKQLRLALGSFNGQPGPATGNEREG